MHPLGLPCCFCRGRAATQMCCALRGAFSRESSRKLRFVTRALRLTVTGDQVALLANDHYGPEILPRRNPGLMRSSCEIESPKRPSPGVSAAQFHLCSIYVLEASRAKGRSRTQDLYLVVRGSDRLGPWLVCDVTRLVPQLTCCFLT